jgi:hypothetical protein
MENEPTTKEDIKNISKKREYYEKNKERIKEYSLNNYYENIEERRAKSHEHYFNVKKQRIDGVIDKINKMSSEEKSELLIRIADRYTTYIISILEKN